MFDSEGKTYSSDSKGGLGENSKDYATIPSGSPILLTTIFSDFSDSSEPNLLIIERSNDGNIHMKCFPETLKCSEKNFFDR